METCRSSAIRCNSGWAQYRLPTATPPSMAMSSVSRRVITGRPGSDGAGAVPSDAGRRPGPSHGPIPGPPRPADPEPSVVHAPHRQHRDGRLEDEALGNAAEKGLADRGSLTHAHHEPGDLGPVLDHL